MSSIITVAGENLIALKQGGGQLLIIDKMIFANVPGVDPEAAIDRTNQKPAADQIVHEYDIPAEYKKFVNPNQVVYSAVLDSNAGDFDFNWIGLYSTADDVVVAITTLPVISKFKTAGQLQGNHLTRNFMLSFEGAAESTGMTVAADTWQLDFSTRLADLDERDRMTNRDTYGRARFWSDGFKLVNNEGTYSLSAGVGYVEGIRIDLENPLPIASDNFPKSVWLDVCLTPQGSTVVARAVPVFGDSFEDSTQGGIKHYFVKIAEIDGTGKVADFRNIVEIRTDLIDYLIAQIEKHKTDPDAHMELLAKLATGVPEIIFPENNAVDVGETPVFIWGQFVPIFINTTLNAVQVQVDHASNNFISPLFDSGPDSVAAAENRFTMPANYLLVSNMYKVRVRWRLNTGQWSPWSVTVVFTTKAEFNYVARPEILAPADGLTGVQERPELESGPFSVIGGTADTHYSTQFMVKSGDQVLHLSPEILGGFTYQLPAGILAPGSDYDVYCKHTGQVLGESDWSFSSSFHTASAFIEGDAAILLVVWAIAVKATTTGTALEDGAELYSNSTDQDANDGDWAEFVINAKVRGKRLTVAEESTQNLLITPNNIVAGELLATDLGVVTVGNVSPIITGSINNPDPFGDGTGIALYQFENDGTNKGTEGGEWSGDITYTAGKFSKGMFAPGNYAAQADNFSLNPQHSFSYWSTGATGFGIPDGYLHNHIGLAGTSIFGWFDSPQHNGIGYLPVEVQNSLNAIFTGGWHHICLTPVLDGVQLWIDGVLIYTRAASSNPSLIATALQSQYGTTADQYYDQLRVFNRGLVSAEVQALMAEETTTYSADISAGNFASSPNLVQKIPHLTAATGPAGVSFLAEDFVVVPIAEAILGTDTDPDMPDYVYLKSLKQTKAGFRCIAMGAKDIAKGGKILVTEARIDTWKLGA